MGLSFHAFIHSFNVYGTVSGDQEVCALALDILTEKLKKKTSGMSQVPASGTSGREPQPCHFCTGAT